MNVLEITIQHRQETGWPVVAEYSRSGQLPRRSEGVLSLLDEYDRKLLELMLDADGYGTYLGEELFLKTIRDAFMRARTEAETAQEPLRILLVVEDPVLKILRWERLCAPDSSGSWDFLALDQNNPFSLYLPSLTDRRFPAIGRRNLRALVLLADPPEGNTYNGGLAVFDAQATADSISKALGDIPCDLLGPVNDAVGPADKNTLYRQITEQHYTLLHIVAHGSYNSAGETILYLLDSQNQVAPLPASELIRDLKRLRGVRGLPHLAFLCTCESAKPDAESGLGGLGQRLVRDLGLPAVVA
ncbi:MAG: CHAT domain-containing protein, partial [Candidatus Electrothrix sp. AR3]|nr:CHAT domain-containing protein [Candidatus Electrothrix sp. AR3]